MMFPVFGKRLLSNLISTENANNFDRAYSDPLRPAIPRPRVVMAGRRRLLSVDAILYNATSALRARSAAILAAASPPRHNAPTIGAAHVVYQFEFQQTAGSGGTGDGYLPGGRHSWCKQL
jgi:hypothetical protein